MKRFATRAVLLGLFFGLAFLLLVHIPSFCQTDNGFFIPEIKVNNKEVIKTESNPWDGAFNIMFLLLALSTIPYMLMLVTTFMRITITFSFMRQALGTQQVPPTQILMALAFIMTIYIMWPVGHKINQEAYQPFLKGDLNQNEFLEKGFTPLRDFMLRQTRDGDLKFWANLAKLTGAENRKDLPPHVVIPAFVVSEVKVSFEIGLLLFLPFLLIDMIVSTILMTMGMHMLSPMMISMPFKLVLFVAIDGWGLIYDNLIRSFNM